MCGEIHLTTFLRGKLLIQGRTFFIFSIEVYVYFQFPTLMISDKLLPSSQSSLIPKDNKFEQIGGNWYADMSYSVPPSLAERSLGELTSGDPSFS